MVHFQRMLANDSRRHRVEEDVHVEERSIMAAEVHVYIQTGNEKK